MQLARARMGYWVMSDESVTIADDMRVSWPRVGICLLSLAYVLIFSWLCIQQHRALNTHALDLGQLDQAIWNTTRGRFMANTLKPPNSMATHFSPGLVLFALLYSLGFDLPVLFVVQTVALGAVGLILYRLLEEHSPTAGLLTATAYYLNPFLHETNFSEFRRITPAVFFVALALYGLVSNRRKTLLLGLLCALLFKESVAVVVIAVGLYLLLRREWKLGGGLLALGTIWLVAVSLVVIPYFAGGGLGIGYYPQFAYYSYGGGTLKGIWRTLLHDPLSMARQMVAEEKLRALGRVLLPTGFLVFLAPSIAALSLPTLGYMLASTDRDMSTFRNWYPAILLPIWFVAVAVGLRRLKKRRRTWAVLYLLLMSGLTFVLYSPTPLGRASQPGRFQVTRRDRVAESVLSVIPAEAPVSAQTALVPHLSHREEVYLFPLTRAKAQYVALDTQGHLYPLDLPSYEREIQQMLSDPEWEIIADVEGYYVLRRNRLEVTGPAPAIVGRQLSLLSFELAVQDDDGKYISRPLPYTIAPGRGLRLTLYWQCLAPMNVDYSVFVHLLGPGGQMVAQHDGWPGNGLRLTELWQPMPFKRTSQWAEGEVFRDIHYLQLSPDAATGEALLKVGMYDLESGQRLTAAEPDGTPLLDDSIPIAEIGVQSNG
jgi:uncharacterized membrane protein